MKDDKSNALSDEALEVATGGLGSGSGTTRSFWCDVCKGDRAFEWYDDAWHCPDCGATSHYAFADPL